MERAEGRILESTEQKKKQQAAEKEKRISKKKDPWSWLRIEARKCIIEIVGEIEKQGRVRKGELKKRKLLDKLEERRKEQVKKKESDLLVEVEKLGRLKKGEMKKKELLEKLRSMASAKQYNSNEQLLVMNLVGGDRNGSRKRIWSKRGGLWASWLGERVHRVVRTGLRRRTIQHMDITTCSVEGSQEDHNMDTTITTETISGAKDDSLVDRMADLMIKHGELDADDSEQMDISLYQTPIQMASMSPTSTSRHWEMEENIWLTKVAMALGVEVMDEFLQIEERLDPKVEVFGQEVFEHQYLEEWQVTLGLFSKHLILDSFNTSLTRSMGIATDENIPCIAPVAEDNKINILVKTRTNSKDSILRDVPIIDRAITNYIAQEPQQEQSMEEQGEEATQAEDPDSITLSEDDSVTRMAWSTEDPSSIKDKRINIDVVQDVEQQYLMDMVALQET